MELKMAVGALSRFEWFALARREAEFEARGPTMMCSD